MYLFLNVCSVFGTNNQLKTDEKKIQWKESMRALEKRNDNFKSWYDLQSRIQRGAMGAGHAMSVAKF